MTKMNAKKKSKSAANMLGLICLLFLSSFSFAQTPWNWTLKRASIPKATPVTGMYQPAVPGIDDQEMALYDAFDKGIASMQQDQGYSGSEYSNALFLYKPELDDGTSLTGPGAGFVVIWESYNTQKNSGGGLNANEFAGISCSSGVVTITTPANSAQFLKVGTYLNASGFPTGFSNGLFRVSALLSAPSGTYGNMYTKFSYNDPACVNGSGTPGPSTLLVNVNEYPNNPSRRHTEGFLYDQTRNVFRLTTGQADINTDYPLTVNGAHSGIADLYEFANANGAWGASILCGFGAPGPCGQETLTKTTTGPQVAGIPCLDTSMTPGALSSGGNNSSCGYKFPLVGRVEETDVDVIFGGQWNSGNRCETLLYYRTTGHYFSVGNPLACGTATQPAARWNTASSRLVPIGNGKILMFGGNSSVALPGIVFNDTWILQTYPEAQASLSSWTRVNSAANPPLEANPVIDYAHSIQAVVLVDHQSPAHIWTFDPVASQWKDQGNGVGAQLPSFVSAINNGTTIAYNTIGAIDQATNQFVIWDRCSTNSTPACTSTQTKIWTLDLPSFLSLAVPASCDAAQVGVAYTCNLQAAGGVLPYSFSQTGLPAGLSLDPKTGIISGTPSGFGSFSVNATVKDSQ